MTLILEGVASEIPLLLTVDDAHWIDAPSTEVIVRLAQTITSCGVLLVVAYDDDIVEYRHPLTRARSAVVTSPGVSRIQLKNFRTDTVETVLLNRYGNVPDQRLADWLVDRTDGNPLFLHQYLAMLDQQGVLMAIGSSTARSRESLGTGSCTVP